MLFALHYVTFKDLLVIKLKEGSEISIIAAECNMAESWESPCSEECFCSLCWFFSSFRAAEHLAGSLTLLRIMSSSLYLFKLGLAPQIQDLCGRLTSQVRSSRPGRKCLIYVEIAWRVNCTNLKDAGL